MININYDKMKYLALQNKSSSVKPAMKESTKIGKSLLDLYTILSHEIVSYLINQTV